jgi:serine/threonine protein kinase
MRSEPKSIGPYKLIKRIGHGAFAKVDLAVHESLNVHVAVKIIPDSKLAKSPCVEKGLFEIEVYRNLRHRNIVELFEVIRTEMNLCLVMEFAPNGDFYSILNRKGKLSENEARQYFRQIISALVYCHAQGFAHRDLKLENVFVGEFNEVKIGDFGLAGTLRTGNHMSTSCGSLRYASPEVLKGDPYSGELADVWSCGVMLFTFLAGYHPFDDNAYMSLLQKIKYSHYELPDNLSADAIDLIKGIFQVR